MRSGGLLLRAWSSLRLDQPGPSWSLRLKLLVLGAGWIGRMPGRGWGGLGPRGGAQQQAEEQGKSEQGHSVIFALLAKFLIRSAVAVPTCKSFSSFDPDSPMPISDTCLLNIDLLTCYISLRHGDCDLRSGNCVGCRPFSPD